MMRMSFLVKTDNRWDEDAGHDDDMDGENSDADDDMASLFGAGSGVGGDDDDIAMSFFSADDGPDVPKDSPATAPATPLRTASASNQPPTPQTRTPPAHAPAASPGTPASTSTAANKPPPLRTGGSRGAANKWRGDDDARNKNKGKGRPGKGEGKDGSALADTLLTGLQQQSKDDFEKLKTLLAAQADQRREERREDAAACAEESKAEHAHSLETF